MITCKLTTLIVDNQYGCKTQAKISMSCTTKTKMAHCSPSLISESLLNSLPLDIGARCIMTCTFVDMNSKGRAWQAHHLALWHA